jgi:predicted nucleic acid-binding protein
MGPERVLVDTWGWLALADAGERHHVAVRGALADIWGAGGHAVTTDYVLDETVTLVFRRLPFVRARRFIAVLDEAEQEGTLVHERIGVQRFTEAKALRLRFRDKPRISFTDLTTMVVMRELRLTRIITADDHFRQVGFGFITVP